MNEPFVGIVIVNYNGEKYQNDCVRTIKAMNYSNYRIIVVDSHSTDDSIRILKDRYPDVDVIFEDDNVGVARGNNIGIEYSISLGTEYTLLLNNDVEVAPDLLDELIKNADRESVTVPKIYYYDHEDVIWYAGGELVWKIGLVVHTGYGKKDLGQYNEQKNVSYAPTCCMLIYNGIFSKVGMMDETVFMYFDDTDYCVRLQENKYKIKYIPNAKLWHKVSSSAGGNGSRLQIYYMRRNQLYYIHKHRKYMHWYWILKIVVMDMIRVMLSAIWRKNNRYIWYGYMDYLHGRMGRKDFGR